MLQAEGKQIWRGLSPMTGICQEEPSPMAGICQKEPSPLAGQSPLAIL